MELSGTVILSGIEQQLRYYVFLKTLSKALYLAHFHIGVPAFSLHLPVVVVYKNRDQTGRTHDSDSLNSNTL